MRLWDKKVQYACAALFELSLEYGGRQPVQVHAIAERQNVPTNYLVQILIALRRAGMVDSVRGSQGGYRLAISPERITLAMVIRIVDGPFLHPRGALQESDGRLASNWLETIEKAARDTIERQFESVTMADVVNRYLEPLSPTYNI